MLFTCTGLENITPAPDSCSSSPCQHSGRCHQTGDDTGYSCLCVQGYTGDKCQTGNREIYCGSNKSQLCISMMICLAIINYMY